MLLSCIGRTALHYDGDNERVRQFSTEYVDDPVTLHQLLSHANDFAEHHGATRIVVRALTNQNLLLSAATLAASLCYRLESIIVVGSDFAGYNLVTYARNLTTRFSSSSVVLQQQQMLFDVRNAPKRGSDRDLMAKVKAAGFRVERLQGERLDADHQDLATMISSSLQEEPSAFRDEIAVLLRDPEKYTVVALRSEDTGRLYGMCASERKNIAMRNGRTLRLAEKAWAVKNHHADGENQRGLTAILHLALQLDAYRQRTHVLFAESRSALVAINRINHCAGMRAGGMLEKHVTIGGDEDVLEGQSDRHSTYRNMNVWFINHDELGRVGPHLAALLEPVGVAS